MKIAICGSRFWNNEELIKYRLTQVPKGSTIVHGACRGADQMAGWIAREIGLKVIEYPADWNKFFKAAGPIRNTQILERENPELVIAFHNNIAKSKGTKDMLLKAKAKGIKTELISE